MRIAYGCRGLAEDSVATSGAHAFAAAAAMAQHGHDVWLVSESLGAHWRRALARFDRLQWQPLVAARPRHRYFTDQHCYADRVYDTICLLHGQEPLDVIDLVDAGGEALTILRARRLLGRFPTTRLVVSLHPWATATHGPQAYRPATFTTELVAFAERYVRQHADVLLSPSPTVALAGTARTERDRHYVPGLPDLGPPPRRTESEAAATVLWLGCLRPDSGLDVTLRALELARQQFPSLRLVLRGEDTLTDPVGRSYWQHIYRGLSTETQQAVTFSGPLEADDLGAPPPPGTQCVLGAGVAGSPAEALWAMASGCITVAMTGSVGAGFVQDGHTGRIVPAGDSAALASAILAAAQDTQLGSGQALLAATITRSQHTPELVASSLTAAYESSPLPVSRWRRRPEPELVSVVIPVHNHGQFLPEAVESVRRSGYGNLEIVVINDGAADCDTAAEFDSVSGVVKIRQPHRGISAARNAGIRRSSGGLVLLLDSDDKIQPGFLPAAVAAMQRDDTLGFVSGYVRYFGLLDLVYVPAGMATELNLVLHTHLKSMVLYRKDAVDDVGGYDERLPAFEDWELQLRMALAGYESDVLPITGLLYRRHSDSVSFTQSNGMRNELVQYLVRKHAAALSQPQLISLLVTLVDLWKTCYEPSTSVRLQQALSGSRPAGGFVTP
jgi:glycogen synthase